MKSKHEQVELACQNYLNNIWEFVDNFSEIITTQKEKTQNNKLNRLADKMTEEVTQYLYNSTGSALGNTDITEEIKVIVENYSSEMKSILSGELQYQRILAQYEWQLFEKLESLEVNHGESKKNT